MVVGQAVSWLQQAMALLLKHALQVAVEVRVVVLVLLVIVMVAVALVVVAEVATKADKVAVLVLDNQECK